MTTAPRNPRTGQRPGVAGRAVAVAGLVSLGLGALLVAAAALVDGSAGAAGAAIGIAMVLVFFGLGALALDVVAGLAPSLSLMVALLTYTLQVVLVGLVFVGLNRSGLLGERIDAEWLGGTVIVGTLAWIATQLVATVRTRRPLYDLPAARTPEATGGEAAEPGEGARRGGSGGLPGAKEATAR